MWFSLSILILLTTFPSFQTTINKEKKNATGTTSEPKPQLITLSLTKPKTATLVKLTKQTPKSTPKVLMQTTANQTLPVPSILIKPVPAMLVKITKETPKPTSKAISPTTANQTLPAPSNPIKPPTAKLLKPTKAAPRHTLKTLTPTLVNQTLLATLNAPKPPTAKLVKLSKEIPKPTQKPLRPTTANQTLLSLSSHVKPPTATEVKLSKETTKPTQKHLSSTAANQSLPAPSNSVKTPAANLVKLSNETSKSTLKSLSPNAANQTLPAPSNPVKPPTVTLVKLSKESPKPTQKTLSPTTANQTLPTPSNPFKPSKATLVKLLKETTKRTQKPLRPTEANQTLPALAKPLKPKTVSNPKTTKTTKDKPSTTSPQPNPIKVLVTSEPSCIHKNAEKDAGNRTKEHTQTHELKVKHGSPLTLTHHISLVPTFCTGACVAEMAALKGRVARLEKEMSLMKSKCASCSKGLCPKDCSGNGKCEKGKCVCLPGFLGLDCSASDKVQITVETVTLKLSPESKIVKESGQGKKAKADQTLFKKKTDANDLKKATATKEGDIKTKDTTTVKAGLFKTLPKQGVKDTKTNIKGSSHSNATKIGLGRPTVGQVLLKHHGERKQESKGKTTVLKKKSNPDLKLKVAAKEESAGKDNAKSGNLNDQPQANLTQSTLKTTANKTQSGKETLEQSTLAEKNVTLTSEKKVVKKDKLGRNVNVTKVSFSTDGTKSVKGNKTEADMTQTSGNTGSGKDKTVPQRRQHVINVTTVETTSEVSVLSNKTTTVQSPRNVTKKAGTGVGGGLGSVKVQNVTTYSFTLVWSAPTAMFKNFTVSRTEHGDEGEEEEEEAEEGGTLGGEEKVTVSVNVTEILRQSESTNDTASSTTKAPASSRGKAHTKRVSMVLPGSVRSVEFRNLRPQTTYTLHIYGTTPTFRSKIHRLTVMTGPEPPTELVFSNVTESSFSVSWSKPKGTFTGFKITNTHFATGERHSVSVVPQQSHVSLSKLSSGAIYEVRVLTTMGRRESDSLTGSITTVPAPPVALRMVNVTDTKAVLQWTPAMGKVDRFIISYESAKTPNVTVTVMLSGNSVQHQLRGLQRATLYTVKALSQKDSMQSTAVTTTFTTASAVKASEVGARSAVVSWKALGVSFSSYRVTYQMAGEGAKEVILDSSATEYKLTGLLSTTKYKVLVEGEEDRQYTSIVTTEFITGNLRFPFPAECSEELLNGELQSGEVDIYPEGQDGKAVRVFCDMETEGGGWTVFQRRMNGKANFYRSWSDYTNGFGNLSEEFWLGNELLHNLTSMVPVSLRVDLRSGNQTAYALYTNFTVNSEAKHYAIDVSGYTGTAGDSMKYHNGRPFSTKDKDPAPLGIHCARAYMGGWWYKNCYKTNLNGLYGTDRNNQGVVWIDWKGKDSSIPFTEMKLRPAGFSPTTRG
ncbi:tenascin isoform X2 [Esox lucius]|uniref:tenascin isoform X2 n=1 Tax=Esox lucius TaxID=8010 RepID=UPI001476B71A|nr:tenascin isoform X2 [Esox lucius]